MNKFHFTFFSFLFLTTIQAQSLKEKLTGDWKYYLEDRSTFELLRLNADGTGIKCFGKTIDLKDSLFSDHNTTIFITEWSVKEQSLIMKSRNNLSFEINPDYKLRFSENDKLELIGEHLILDRYPSHLIRKDFMRSLTYEKAHKIQGDYGIKKAPCISSLETFIFKPIDAKSQLIEYIGFENITPHLVGCTLEYEYPQFYKDAPYSIAIPATLQELSYGFGNNSFYFSFNSPKNDTSETSIVIYYDFKDENRNFYFSEIKAGNEKEETVQLNNRKIYKTKNWQGKNEGKIFLDNHIYIAYYTRDQKAEELLQQCITSFKYK